MKEVAGLKTPATLAGDSTLIDGCIAKKPIAAAALIERGYAPWAWETDSPTPQRR